MVHRRELDGRTLDFGNQGDLWRGAMTWFDHETGSVWSQPGGEAILGPLTGATLELLPSTLTTWTEWLREHPDSRALEVPAMRRLDIDRNAIAVETSDGMWAITLAELRETGFEALDQSDARFEVEMDPNAPAPRSWMVAADGTRTPAATFNIHIGDFVELFPDGLVRVGGVDVPASSLPSSAGAEGTGYQDWLRPSR